MGEQTHKNNDAQKLIEINYKIKSNLFSTNTQKPTPNNNENKIVKKFFFVQNSF